MDAPLPRTSRTSLGAGREGVMLLPIARVADRLQCSRGHVHNLINARGYADARRVLPPRFRPQTAIPLFKRGPLFFQIAMPVNDWQNRRLPRDSDRPCKETMA